MSHHGENTSPIPEAIAQALSKPLIGATGLHPDGKLNHADEGSLQFAVGVKDGKVCVDFGTPVAWFGMNPEDALKLATSLIDNARKAARGSGSILTLNI